MMAGSGGSAEASSMEVLGSINNLLNIYAQFEPNPKMKLETQSKISILTAKLGEGSISPGLVAQLKHLTVAAE